MGGSEFFGELKQVEWKTTFVQKASEYPGFRRDPITVKEKSRFCGYVDSNVRANLEPGSTVCVAFWHQEKKYAQNMIIEEIGPEIGSGFSKVILTYDQKMKPINAGWAKVS